MRVYSKADDEMTLFAPETEANVVRRPVVAYCDSDHCCWWESYATKNGFVTQPSRVEKSSVSPRETDCPDCGSSLFWQPIGDDPMLMTKEQYESEQEELNHE